MRASTMIICVTATATLFGCVGGNGEDQSLPGSREEETPEVSGSDRQYLARVEPNLLPSGDHTSWVQDEIPDSVAEMIGELLPAERIRWPRIYQLPGIENPYLIIGREVQRDENTFDGGLRFFLIRLLDDRVQVISRTRGAMDSEYLQPVFFAGQDVVLILANTGAEYSWGLMAFEYADDQLRDLGGINVARAVDEPFPTTVDPLEYAKVKHAAGAYVVEFDCDIVVDPGGQALSFRRQNADGPFVFTNREGEFKLVSHGGD